MKPVSIFITASAEYFRGLPQKSRDYSRRSKKNGQKKDKGNAPMGNGYAQFVETEYGSGEL